MRLRIFANICQQMEIISTEISVQIRKNFFSDFEVPDSGKAKEGRKKSIRGEERIQREKGRRKEGGNDGDRRSIVHPVSQSRFDWRTSLHGPRSAKCKSPK